MKTFTKAEFEVGASVACYAGEMVTFGEVFSVDGDKVTVAIEYNVYSKSDGRTTLMSLVEYVRRADGMHVAEACMTQRVPSVMISRMSDMAEVNKWRYYPSPIEKLKRKFS